MLMVASFLRTSKNVTAVEAGQLDEARALGWTEPAEMPQWKQHEMQEAAATQAAIPTMLDLDQL